MKKLLIASSIALFSIGSLSAKSSVLPKTQKETVKTTVQATQCFKRAYDAQGHYLGLFPVACPPVIVIG